MHNLDKRILIKDIIIEVIPEYDNYYVDVFKYIETIDNSRSISICDIKEPINLHKLVYRRDDIKQEFIFGITNQASEKFPVLQLVKDLTEENEILIKQNSNLYSKIDDLKSKNNKLELALNNLRNNILIKILKFLRLI